MSKENLPFVSVIVPCRNEEAYIGMCLESVLANDYPEELTEIIVIDGMSTDKTREIIADYAGKIPRLKAMDNPARILAAAWNTGIRNSRGQVVMCLNAHGIFAKDYISRCVAHLGSYPADYVGGVIKTVPRGKGIGENAVAIALSHPFGVGNSYFRIGTDKPIWADTAAFGGYRRQVFDKVGFYNEELRRSQDMEFHLRMKKAGARILLAPDMICTYYTRTDIGSFLRDSFTNGFWTLYPLAFARIAVSWRHLIPLFFLLALLGSLLLSFFGHAFFLLFAIVALSYCGCALYFSFKVAIRQKEWLYLPLMPFVFAALHLLYGAGTLWAALKVLFSSGFWKFTLFNRGRH